MDKVRQLLSRCQLVETLATCERLNAERWINALLPESLLSALSAMDWKVDPTALPAMMVCLYSYPG